MSFNRPKTLTITSFAALSFLVCLASCKGTRKTAPVTNGAQPPLVIRFSDPGNAGPLAYAKRYGLLDAPLAKVNAKIEWVPAAGAFSANFEAMNAGAINASSAAISPIIGALAHNLKFRIFAVSDRSGLGRQAGILAPAGSDIRTIKDLVGKRVAVNLAAHGDYMLLKALADAGVPAEQVIRVPIQPPEAAAAFATGKIDAWSTFGVFYNTAVKNGAHVLAAEADIGSDDIGVNSANAESLAQNPAAWKVFLSVLQDLTELARREPEKFQNVFTDTGPTAVSGDNLRLAIEDTRALTPPRIPTEADKQRVANVAKLFFENKSIDRNITVDDIVFDLNAPAGGARASL
ncbi:MAG: NrtA/SsuA/CpmA family ABC transporter substrate-binding protein [Deltaproteobacteria bacterium]|nr:NrtA/SsuA/CpmA family ABC transporter substrate-binding protein [Deltaproteobacteria bacterium]